MFVYMNEFRIVIGLISMVYAFITWLLTFNAFFLIKTVTLLFNYIYFPVCSSVQTQYGTKIDLFTLVLITINA